MDEVVKGILEEVDIDADGEYATANNPLTR